MIFKRFKPFESPRKFTFRDPDTQREFVGTSIKNLATQVRGYRSANELPELDLLEVVIENFLCSLPLHRGLCAPTTGAKRSFMAYVRGGIALLKNIAYKDFASQNEADSRAETCVHCPKNVFPDLGPFIRWSNDIATRSIGDRKSKYHDKLGICDICSCPLKSKVHYKGTIDLTKSQYEQMKALTNPPCWQVQEGQEVKLHDD